MSDSEDFLLKISPALFSDKRKPSKKKDLKKKACKKKMKLKKLIPNHFIAFKIHEPMIRDNIAQLHQRVIEKNPLLNTALIDLRTLHVTLAVTHLENEERIVELQKKLQNWWENNMKTHFAQPIDLTFKGVGTFGSGVAFVKISKCENYKRLCLLSAAVNDLLSDSGFFMEKRKEFTPHLTLLKLSKNRKLLQAKVKEKISGDIKALNECDDEFGCQDVRDLQLLSMTAKKEDDGYYKCLWEVKTKEELAMETQ